MEHPIDYHSKSLTKAEKNWSTTEKELFAIVEASRKFSPYCANKRSLSILDHLPIKIYQETTRSERGKLPRWLCELENFEYEIHYIRGKDNFDADYLSRIERIPDNGREHQQKTVFTTTEVIQPVDIQQILSRQKQDVHIANAINQLEAKRGNKER